MWVSTCRYLMLELNPRLYNKLTEEAWFWKKKGGVRLILLCIVNPDLIFGLFQSKDFSTLCSSSLFNWLFKLTDHLQLLPSAKILQDQRVYNKYLCFIEASQSFARDFNEVRISLLQYINFFNMLRESDFYFLGKHLSSKGDSENFSLAFLTWTCQKRFGWHPTLKHIPFSSSLTF